MGAAKRKCLTVPVGMGAALRVSQGKMGKVYRKAVTFVLKLER